MVEQRFPILYNYHTRSSANLFSKDMFSVFTVLLQILHISEYSYRKILTDVTFCFLIESTSLVFQHVMLFNQWGAIKIVMLYYFSFNNFIFE